MIIDLEADGLLDQATKIHVLSWEDAGGHVHSTHDYDMMRKVLMNAPVLMGHNIIRYDVPLIEKVLGITPEATMVDTLALSWYLEPSHMRHGLDDWGKRLGVMKPKITDWNSLTPEEYAHRCEEDVKINSLLWERLNRKLSRLYRDDHSKQRLIDYLSFKLSCARDQEAYRWRLDVPKAEALLSQLTQLKEDKELQLRKAMPKKPITKVMNPPKVMYKKDGTLSARGEAWHELMREKLLPASTSTPVTVVSGMEDGNPNSHEQVKDWLFNLGWVPRTFKYIRGEEYGQERKIPQIRSGSDLCPSVLDLVNKDPAIELLDGLSVISHRLGVVKGFVTSHEDGWLKAEVAGLTNTFRFKHMKPLVNIPAVDKPYGKEIRGCLIAPAGDVLIGSDMVSLEDTTKRHYMKPLDPDYVAEMSVEGYDPHLQLAKFAGACTQEDIDQHTAGTKDMSPLRKNYKAVNYSAIYGVGAQKLARTTGMGQQEAKRLIEAYWKRNWAVKKVAESQKVREIGGELWMRNPVSGFWHNLRYEKDRFSTLNQSTGVYCFDTWVGLVKDKGCRVIFQAHDEIVVQVKEEDADKVQAQLKDCIREANDILKLNIELDVDTQKGDSYSAIH
jgi:hypothetical protein